MKFQPDTRSGGDVVEPDSYYSRQKQGVNLRFPVQDFPGNRHGQSHHFRFHPLEVGFSLAGEIANRLNQPLLLACQLFLKFCPSLSHPFIPALYSGACFPRSDLIFANQWGTGRRGIGSPQAFQGGRVAADRRRLCRSAWDQGRRIHVRLRLRISFVGWWVRIRQHTRHPQNSSESISLPLRACVPVARFLVGPWLPLESAPALAPPCPLLTSVKRA